MQTYQDQRDAVDHTARRVHKSFRLGMPSVIFSPGDQTWDISQTQNTAHSEFCPYQCWWHIQWGCWSWNLTYLSISRTPTTTYTLNEPFDSRLTPTQRDNEHDGEHNVSCYCACGSRRLCPLGNVMDTEVNIGMDTYASTHWEDFPVLKLIDLKAMHRRN